jgi:hypothetical protein
MRALALSSDDDVGNASAGKKRSTSRKASTATKQRMSAIKETGRREAGESEDEEVGR